MIAPDARLARRLRALLCDGGDEGTFSDGLQVLRSILTIAGSGIDEDGLFDIVTGARVRPEVLQVISAPRRRDPPEMMMGIDDRQFGVEHRFGCLLSQPTHLCVVVGMRHGLENRLAIVALASRASSDRGGAHSFVLCAQAAVGTAEADDLVALLHLCGDIRRT